MRTATEPRLLRLALVWVAIFFLPFHASAQMRVDANQLALFEIYGTDEDEWIVPLTENTRQPKELFGIARLDIQRATDSADDIRLSLLSVEHRLELHKSITVTYGLTLADFSGSRTTPRTGSASETVRTNGNGAGVYVGLRLDSTEIWRSRLFVEGAIGSILASDSIPPDGDNLVFFQRYAIGVTFSIARQWHFLLGASHMRFNSQSRCCSGKASINTNGGFIAISYEY